VNAQVIRLRQRWEENSPLGFLLKAMRYPFRPLLVPGAIRSLRGRAAAPSSIQGQVQLVKTFKHGGITITPWQVDSEIEALLERLAGDRPRTILDIGTADGGTLFLLSRVAADDALIISVDLHGGMFGGGYPRWRAPLYRSFARERQRIELVRANSHDPGTLERIRAILAGREVDFLFIDGDHRYEGVKSDFVMYEPLVRPGGLIGFHDIIPGPEELVGGVPDFWQELKQHTDADELVEDWDFGSCGIGVVRKEGASPDLADGRAASTAGRS
jgi:predicted O-methyltransferase YrrM